MTKCQECPLNQPPYNPGLVVPGIGFTDCRVMMIGEAPGFHESKEGIPFIGEAGQILQKCLIQLNIKFEDLYITNIVKHRPPENRDPTFNERLSCYDHYLVAQIMIVNPQAILCLGKMAGQTLANVSDIKLPTIKLRGKKFNYKDSRFDFREIPVMITYHPAYILRSPERYDDMKSDINELYLSTA